jgi:hypothetical protein
MYCRRERNKGDDTDQDFYLTISKTFWLTFQRIIVSSRDKSQIVQYIVQSIHLKHLFCTWHIPALPITPCLVLCLPQCFSAFLLVYLFTCLYLLACQPPKNNFHILWHVLLSCRSTFHYSYLPYYLELYHIGLMHDLLTS